MVGEHEFNVPHEVGPARQLSNAKFGRARSHRFPIDRRRIDDLGIVLPAVEHFVTLVGEIFDAVGEHPLGDGLADQVGRDIPIGVDVGIAQQRGHHRGRRLRGSDDHLHAVDRAAVLEHPQLRGGGIDQDIFARVGRARCRQAAGALEVDHDPPFEQPGPLIERGERCRAGLAVDRKPVRALEGAKPVFDHPVERGGRRRKRIRRGNSEPLAKKQGARIAGAAGHDRPDFGDQQPGQAAPLHPVAD